MHWSIQVMAEIWVYFQFLTITNTMVQITMMMTFGKSIYYNFFVFNSWSYIFIFLMVCCTSMSQVTHLRFDYQLFFCTCSALAVSQFSSIAVMSDSLQPCGLQHAMLSCPSPSPGVCSNSCPLSWMVVPSNHLILSHPLLLLPSIFPSIRVLSNESALRVRADSFLKIFFK